MLKVAERQEQLEKKEKNSSHLACVFFFKLTAKRKPVYGDHLNEQTKKNTTQEEKKIEENFL